jgi:hypothetical protein
MRVLPFVVFLSLLCACDVVVPDPAADAGGPSVRAIWDPRTCAGDGRVRVEVRLSDGAGLDTIGSAPCGEGAIEIAVGRIGWYLASAIALDRSDGARALASETIAIDGPAVAWRVPW